MCKLKEWLIMQHQKYFNYIPPLFLTMTALVSWLLFYFGFFSFCCLCTCCCQSVRDQKLLHQIFAYIFEGRHSDFCDNHDDLRLCFLIQTLVKCWSNRLNELCGESSPCFELCVLGAFIVMKNSFQMPW